MPRSRDSDGMPTIVKLGLAGGAGYLLYLLLSNLGFGGGGAGTGAPGKGEPKARVDAAPLEVLIRPRPGAADPSETEIVLDGQPISFDDLVVRVLRGGRSDLKVKISGATIEGKLAEILAKLTSAGISYFKQL